MIVVLGGAALIAALLFLYVAAAMFAGGKGFMRRVSHEERYRFHLLREPPLNAIVRHLPHTNPQQRGSTR